MDGDAIIKVVFGQRGSGKTTKAAALVADKPRLVVYDSLGHDYRNGVVCEDRQIFELLWRVTYRGRFRLVYRPHDPVAEFPDVCRLASACGNLSFLVEEVDLYFRAAQCDPAFTNVISRGRHDGIELIAVTQCPTGFGSLLRAQAHEWFIFATREPRHVAYLTERCAGVDAQQILSLQQFEYLHYIDGADCYWRCLDDLTTGQTRTEEIRYANEAPRCDAATGEHADAR